jgi:NAD(P)-dependent dehydrogenase (short-subunit alcohol dehydrogenase family)
MTSCSTRAPQERAAALSNLASGSAGVVIGDLRSAAETRSIADQVNAIGRMDAVIHNAGIYRTPGRDATPEGHPSILAVNALAPFILTMSIDRPDRLIYLSSSEHHAGSGPLRDVNWETRRWDAARAYGESKLYVVALAFALARRWSTVLSHAVDPGWARSRMGGPDAPVDTDTGQRTQTWLAVSTSRQRWSVANIGISNGASSPRATHWMSSIRTALSPSSQLSRDSHRPEGQCRSEVRRAGHRAGRSRTGA